MTKIQDVSEMPDVPDEVMDAVDPLLRRRMAYLTLALAYKAQDIGRALDRMVALILGARHVASIEVLADTGNDNDEEMVGEGFVCFVGSRGKFNNDEDMVTYVNVIMTAAMQQKAEEKEKN